ncbi:MAG: stage II sporulation protein M [Chitinophagales bacterium]
MKESRFIDQNKDKWASFEDELKQKKKDPDKLSDLFVQLTDDLSFSRTYYPNRLVRAYLNSVSQKIYLNFYKNKKNYLKNFVNFWKEDLPFIVYESRKELSIAFIVFTLATLIGVLSCLKDPAYAEVVVGKAYVEMTKANIADGDPMAVYKNGESFYTFLWIFWNNIRVAFYTFVLGVTAGVGTIFILLKNGTMLGGFQFFFYDKGVFAESLITVWQHGTIEILSIIIAGGAGLVLAKGLIMPGTFPRLQSLQISTKKGLKIMMGLTPFILAAALIEGFITRLTEAPFVFRLGLIIASLVLMFGYWVYYPWRKKREGFSEALKNRAIGFERPIEDKLVKYSLVNIKGVGEIFTDSFRMFRNNIGKFFVFSLIIATLYGFAHVHYAGFESNYYEGENFVDLLMNFLENLFLSFFSFFKFSNKPLIQFLNMFMLGMLFPIAFAGFDKVFGFNQGLSFAQKLLSFLKYFIYGAIAAVLLYAVFYFDSGWSYVLFMLMLPVVIMPFSALLYDKKMPTYGLKLMFSNLVSVILVLLVFFLLFLCFMLISNFGIASLILDFIKMNFQITGPQMQMFYDFTSAFLGIFTFSFFFPIFIYGFTFIYYSNKEHLEANHLIERIKNM